MVFKLVFLVFDALVSPSAPMISEYDEMLCDDGSLAWDEGPNWECTRDGCTPHDDVCWSDRLAHCRDRNGKDLGTCVYERDDCDTRWDCFNMWLYCAGKYECTESGGIGCLHGTCTTDEAAARLDLTQGSGV